MIKLLVFRITAVVGMTAMILGLKSCATVFEEDITEEEISFNSPNPGQVVTTGSLTLSWTEIDDAVTYELRIVAPDFSENMILLLDTTVSDASLNLSFDDGSYGASVKAVNSSSETEIFTVLFSVEGSGLFDNQQVQLILPQEGSYLASLENTFAWNELEDAESYTVRIYEDDDGVTGDDIVQEIVTDTIFSFTLEEGQYFLDVSAYDGTTNTADSRVAFGIDTTAPSIPILLSPESGSFVLNEVSFTWSSGQDELSSVQDSIFIYVLNSPELVFSQNVSSPFVFQLDSLEVGDYDWGIWTTDEAGNYSESAFSVFTVN